MAGTLGGLMIEDNYRASLIRDLVRRQMIQSQTHIPSTEWNKKEQTLFLYSQQLLSSSMAPSIPLNDHHAIMEKLKTCLHDRKGQLEYALKILDESKEANKWRIIYFLIRLEEKGRMPIKFIESNAHILKALRINDDEILNDPRSSSFPTKQPSLSSNVDSNAYSSFIPSFAFPSASSSSSLHFHSSSAPLPPNASILLASEKQRITELTPSAAFTEYSKTKSRVNEIALIKDCLYALQGINSNSVKSNGRADPTLSVPIRSALEEFASFGILFKNIERIIELSKQSFGSIKQCFAYNLRLKLRTLIQCIADFELVIEKNSLMQTVIWLRGEPRKILESLYEIAIKSEHLHGAKLISMLNYLINQNSSHFKSEMASEILNAIRIPFEKIIEKWIFTGQIKDIHEESFITSNATLNRENIPSTMTVDDANKILMIGKTRLFLSSCPSFNESILLPIQDHYHYHADHGSFTDKDDNNNIATITTTINNDSINSNNSDNNNNQIKRKNDTILLDTCNMLHALYAKELSRIIAKQSHLQTHILSIYDFLFFGRDDFFTKLIDQIGEEKLNKPVSGEYYFKHALYGVLDVAMRGKSCIDLSQNLDIKLLEIENSNPSLHDSYSHSHNHSIGNSNSNNNSNGNNLPLSCWDIFALEYRIAFPLNTILTNEIMKEMMDLSQFLWQLKKTEFLLRKGHERLIMAIKNCSFDNRKDKKLECFRFQLLYHELIIMCKQIISICYESIQLAINHFNKELNKFNEHDDLFDLNQLVKLVNDLVDLMKKRCLPWSNGSLRLKLSSLLTDMIKLVNLSDSFTNSTKSLAEIRISFQSIARQSQVDIDLFLMQIQKEANAIKLSSKITLDDLDWEQLWMSMLDVNEYHQRRSGFDINKYGKTMMIS